MANTNLFYSLYSTSNDTVKSTYTCSSAVDEADTSFDISGDEATITDSNGDELASLDLSEIHISPVTQYNTETRIIQPYSCYLLQGQEYGNAQAAYYYIIPQKISEVDGYEYYCNISFDLYCDCAMVGCVNNRLHVQTTIDGETAAVELLNNDFSEYGLSLTVSIQTLQDCVTKQSSDYLVIQADSDTFFFYLRRVRMQPVFASTEYPDSPFSDDIDDLRDIVYDLLVQFHPLLPDEVYDEDDYEPNCVLYEWILCNYREAIRDVEKFQQVIWYLQEITSTTDNDQANDILNKANELIADTVYEHHAIEQYDDNNMEVVLRVIESLGTIVHERLTPKYVWLRECIDRRVPMMKYPNGAFKGIVLLPDWPTTTDDYDYASLWINHIQDEVTIAQPIDPKKHMWDVRRCGVLANAALISEKSGDCNCCGSNMPVVNVIDAGYEDGTDNEVVELDDQYTEAERAEMPYEAPVFMGRSAYSSKESVIGLYRYIQYVSDENLWQKVGTAYMILGKDDDPNEKTKNLPSSILVYNPNAIPVRVKFMIFS